MLHPEIKALEITKEIVTASMTNYTVPASKVNGEKVGEFFQEIYNKILEVTKNISD